MAQSGAGLARDIALSLVDVLTAYETELVALERRTPAVEPLRRAVGLALVDARGVVAKATAGVGDTLQAH